MLKFVVLSVLALGCYAQSHQTLGGITHGLGGGVYGYGSGYGSSGLVSGLGSGYGGSLYRGGYGVGYDNRGIGSVSGIIGGGLGYGYGLGHGQAYSGFMPNYRYMLGYQPSMGSSYMVAQPQHGMIGGSHMRFEGRGGEQGLQHAGQYGIQHGGQYGQFGQFGGQNMRIEGRNAQFGVEGRQANAAINFLTLHRGEPHQEVVEAAVSQLGRTVEYKSLPYQEQPMQAQIVEVEPSEIPLHIHFKTKSSSVSLSQSHQQQQAPEAQLTQSQDEPARLIHEIQKPIIQEVREVITPYRQVTQEIQPVVEAVHTVVSKAEGRRQQYAGNVQYQAAGVSEGVSTGMAHGVSAGMTHGASAGMTHGASAGMTHGVVAQPLSVGFQQQSAVVAQPMTTAIAAQPVATAVAAQPIAYGVVAQPLSYGISSIAQPVATIASGVQPIIGSSISYEPVVSGFGYESSGSSISQPLGFSSMVSRSQPLASYSHYSGDISGISDLSRSGSLESRVVSGSENRRF